MALLIAKLHIRFPLLFTNTGFRWLWLATLINSLGNWFGALALNIYVYNLTGSATAIAGLLAAQALPALLLSPVAGVVVDRMSRRSVMLVAHLVAGMTWMLIPFTTTLWSIYAFAMLAWVTTSFYQPAERALAPDLVTKDEMLTANAMLTVMSTTALVIGPALAGLLIAAANTSVALWLNAVSFFLAAFCVLRIQGELPRTLSSEQAKLDWWQEARAGLHYALNRPALRLLLITNFISSFAAAGLLTVELVYVKQVLHGGDVGYGFYYSVAGIGAVIAASSANAWVRRFTLPGAYVGSVLLTGLLFFPYANVPILWFVILVTGFHTIPWVAAIIYVDTMVQLWVGETMRGRIFALLQAERSAGQLLVTALVAPLVDRWGPVLVMNGSGVIYTLVGLYAVAQLGRLRYAEREREL